jgi:hypothetical protein
MKTTPKNLRVLARLTERMLDARRCPRERYAGHPVLTTADLQPGERYHAERLMRLGLLRKTRSSAPWHSRPRALYWRDDSCRSKASRM